MAWPLVLAGPILRRVEPRLVSVWVALSVPASLQIDIWPQPIDTGPGRDRYEHGSTGYVDSSHSSPYSPTRRIGESLHIGLAVLKIAAPAEPLTAGITYCYNITFDCPGSSGIPSSRHDLKSQALLEDVHGGPTTSPPLTPHLALGYGEGSLPTFVLPPFELSDLRLAHGSCRRLHANGYDGLASLDDVIGGSVKFPLQRPHQLFLTGDQIYADDVALTILPALTNTGIALLAGSSGAAGESILEIGDRRMTADQEHFPAGRRQLLVREQAHFTSREANCHLLSFGEYCAMYLFSWCNELWPETMPSWTEIEARLTASAPDDSLEAMLTPVAETDDEALFPTADPRAVRTLFDEQQPAVASFRSTLPKARRALANIPVYMMFDDHEVTDDWNLTREWRTNALVSLLGRVVVRNALLSYALFQGWGNDPERFESGAPQRLLDLAGELFAAGRPQPDADVATEIDRLLGFDGTPPQVDWQYSVGGPRHAVYVLDTRTRRSYESPFSPPGLLAPDELVRQLPPGPLPPGVELLFVVSPAPVVGVPILEELLQPFLYRVMDVRYAFDPKTEVGAAVRDPEPWAFQPFAFEALLDRLQSFQRVVFLSGDVHFGYTALLDYWRGGAPAARFVQLTSSALKNEEEPGLAWLYSGALAQILFGATLLPASRLGWRQQDPVPVRTPPGSAIPWPHLRRLVQDPVLLPARGWPVGTVVTRDPDWVWRFNLVRDERPDIVDPNEDDDSRPSAGQPQHLTPDIDPANALDGYVRTIRRHSAALGKVSPRRVVFTAHVCLIRFEGAAGELRLRHEFYSIHPDSIQPPAADAYTAHVVPLQLTVDAPPTIGADR